MLIVETIGRIRREHLDMGKSIREIARTLHLSRNTVRRILRSGETAFSYEREVQPRPKLGAWADELDRLLSANAKAPTRERLTLIRVYEELRALGYEGGYDAVRRYARRRGEQHASATAEAYIPLTFGPALSQPHDVRAGLSARDAGDGVRRPRARLRVFQGRMHARHLRQSMDVSRARRSFGVGAWNARIYPACCGTVRAPGLDGSPLLLAP